MTGGVPNKLSYPPLHPLAGPARGHHPRPWRHTLPGGSLRASLVRWACDIWWKIELFHWTCFCHVVSMIGIYHDTQHALPHFDTSDQIIAYNKFV